MRPPEPVALLEKWKNITPLVALTVAIGALAVAYASYRFTQTHAAAAASPNIQVVSTSGEHGLHIEGAPRRATHSAHIDLVLTLKNFGLAPTQIVRVASEPLSSGPGMTPHGWAYFTDHLDPITEHEKLRDLRNDPTLGLHSTTIREGETRSFAVGFQTDTLSGPLEDVSNLRIVITFANGVQLTVLPERLAGHVQWHF